MTTMCLSLMTRRLSYTCFRTCWKRSGFSTRWSLIVAKRGLRQAAKPPGRTCILMDVVMPGMNGFPGDAQTDPGPRGQRTIPVIMITTKDQETDRIWGMRQGAVDYLVKPVAGNDLVEKINSVMAA